MGALLRDLQIGLRALRKASGFTWLAVAVLAIGVALCTTAFAIVNGALGKPLPYPEPDRLVMICDAPRADLSRCGVVGAGSVGDWQDTGAFDAIGLVNLTSLTIASDGSTDRVGGSIVTPAYFDAVRAVPAIGRRPAAAAAGSTREILLSHDYWKDRFESATDVVGRLIRSGSGEYVVVGVMPAAFRGPEEYLLGRARYWIVFPPDLADEGRGARYLRAIARLKPGVPLADARSRIASAADRVSAAHPATNATWTSGVVPLHDEIVRDGRPTLRLLAAAAALLEAIVCANLASLLLSRGLTRQREIALRAALGAGRGRVIAGIAAEALIIAAAGGLGGLLGATWMLNPALSLLPALPRTDAMAIDRAAAAFAFGLAAVTAVVASIAPAMAALGVPPGLALQDGARFASEGPIRRRLRRVLVGAEMAISMTLLAAAGLLARTFINVMAIDPGFRAAGVVMARVDLPSPPAGDGAAIRDAAEAVGLIPGVAAAGFVSCLPLYPLNDISLVATIETPRERVEMEAGYRAVTPGYFSALGLGARAGRLLELSDGAGAAGAVVVNDVAAARFAHGPPIGGRLSFQGREGPFEGTVVGVVASVRSQDLMTPPRAEIYVPYVQHPRLQTMFLAARAGGRGDEVANALGPALARIVPRLSVEEIQPYQRLVERAAASSRRNMVLVGLLAAAALLLSGVGLYAVVSHGAVLREREMAIRLALGEPGDRVRRLVVRDGLQLAVIGILAGVGAAYVLTMMLGARLVGVSPHDPLTFAAVSLVLIAIALAASFLPARRAARVDPVIVLREDG